MKVCSRCHIERQDSDFRKRKHKLCKGGFYVAGKCKDCENELSRKYLKNKRATDPAFRQAAIDRVKKYQRTERGIINRRIYKQTDAQKNRQKAYYHKNKERAYSQRLIRLKKEIDLLTDEYIITQLQNPHRKIKYTRQQIKDNPELIEITRVKILMSRLKKSIENNSSFGVCVRCKKRVDKSEFRIQKKTKTKTEHTIRLCRECQKKNSKQCWIKYNKKNAKHNNS